MRLGDSDLTEKISMRRNPVRSAHVLVIAGGAVMDDHTFCLLRLLDEKIRRAAILIEQHQIHVAELDASQRTAASNVLRTLQQDRHRLLCYRNALLTDPSREYIN
jgi:hypothetical protein